MKSFNEYVNLRLTEDDIKQMEQEIEKLRREVEDIYNLDKEE